MKFGYTIVYVPDVAASLAFCERAFGLKRRFLHDSGTYGELDTGETALAFAAHELGHANFPGGHVAASASATPLGVEIGLVTPDVAGAHASALKHGAVELAAPSAKPWGQTVSYVRCPDGTLVELCTPMA
jgi:catechol 2,3-dioxygenase-like lactoylglutathione lyase family enzyme